MAFRRRAPFCVRRKSARPKHRPSFPPPWRRESVGPGPLRYSAWAPSPAPISTRHETYPDRSPSGGHGKPRLQQAAACLPRSAGASMSARSGHDTMSNFKSNRPDRPASSHGTATQLTRRSFLVAMPAFVAACQSMPQGDASAPEVPRPTVSPVHQALYAAMPNEEFPIPAIDVSRIDRQFLRQEVADPTGERAGTLVVDTDNRFLYLVQEDGRALRYGIG